MPEINETTQQPEKTKRQWRVGTFSMGTMLIVLGLVLLLAQFKEFSALELVSTWWPAVMIILGLEILVAVYFSGQEKPTIKYDFLSIFMVLLIGGITFGLYALTTVGIVPALAETVSSRTFSLEVPGQRIPVKESIKNIVVNTSGSNHNFNSFYIRETEADEAMAFGQAAVSASSRDAAEDVVPDSPVNARTVGDTLFLDFQAVSYPNHFQSMPRVDYTLVLPRDRHVQINGDNGQRLKLQVNDLENNWAVASSGTVEVTASTDADLKIDAFAMRLGGEGKWVQSDTEAAGQKLVLSDSHEGIMVFKSPDDEYNYAKGKASVTFGKGSNKLEINAEEVYVNDI